MNGLLGRKVGMTQMFAKNGELIPVTVIEIEPNVVTQVKTVETDGYNSIQLGVEDKRDKLASKAVLGHSKKANTAAKRKVKEIRIGEDQIGNYELGQTLDISMFTAGQLVDVQGTSN